MVSSNRRPSSHLSRPKNSNGCGPRSAAARGSVALSWLSVTRDFMAQIPARVPLLGLVKENRVVQVSQRAVLTERGVARLDVSEKPFTLIGTLVYDGLTGLHADRPSGSPSSKIAVESARGPEGHN